MGRRYLRYLSFDGNINKKNIKLNELMIEISTDKNNSHVG